MPRPPWLFGRLREEGFRLTLPRQAILNILNRTSNHLTAEEIFFIIHRSYPGIGLATVYRTLEILANTGLVSKFDFGDGRSRYELVGKANRLHHHHLVCTKCYRIIDYMDFTDEEISLVDKMKNALSKKHRFEINEHQLNFYGVCNKCRLVKL
jgi:Fur family ferric uptake transcriptional regulator